MVAGRVEAQGRVPGLTAGLWLEGAPLDTLGKAAAELARVPGAAGVACALGAASRDAAREDALRALADALGGRPVSAAPRRPEDAEAFLARVGRANVLLQEPLRGRARARAQALAAAGRAVHWRDAHAPERLDEVLEGWLAGLEERAGAKGSLEGAALVVGVDAGRLDGVYDSIALARMDSAPTDFIRAAYRFFLGRVGWSVAAVCRRRAALAVNGARFAALARRGAPRPMLLVSAPPARLAEFTAPETSLAVPFAEAARPPAFPAGRALEEGYDDAKRLLDKLANYQIDLSVIAAELEEGR